MGAIWQWMLVEENRQLAGFLGAGLAAGAAAFWAVFTYLRPSKGGKKAGSRPPQHAEARDGSIAVVAQDNAKVSIQASPKR